MVLVKEEKLLNYISNIIHEETQLHSSCIDLTVAEICSFFTPGSLDFGGSEFKKASTKTLEPEKRDADDNYGWWNLEEGQYKVTFNEQLSTQEGITAIISLHQHASETGIIAATNVITPGKASELSLNVRVPATGCNIKENARIATMHILDTNS